MHWVFFPFVLGGCTCDSEWECVTKSLNVTAHTEKKNQHCKPKRLSYILQHHHIKYLVLKTISVLCHTCKGLAVRGGIIQETTNNNVLHTRYISECEVFSPIMTEQ